MILIMPEGLGPDMIHLRHDTHKGLFDLDFPLVGFSLRNSMKTMLGNDVKYFNEMF